MTTDQRDRLLLMCDERQQKWDLSPNDQEAIRAVLARVAKLERRTGVDERYIADADACIGDLRARVAELEAALRHILGIAERLNLGAVGDFARAALSPKSRP